MGQRRAQEEERPGVSNALPLKKEQHADKKAVDQDHERHAVAYGDTLDNDVGDAADLVSCLIRSLVSDLS